jgi:hypothetical protein
VGLGALAVISKPPLSFLLLPAILPTMLIGGLVLRRRGSPVRPLLVATVALAGGALVTNVLWGVQQATHGIASYYALDARSLLTFRPEGSIGPLIRYFLGEYQPTWTAFLLVAAMALLRDPRRFLPPLLVALGMGASILLIYLGAWSDVEHESGARYLLHGLDGFMLFALAALAPAIRRTLEAWLGRIAAMGGPGAARRPAPGARVA